MTLTGFVTKSAFRNKRRSLLTVASIAFSLLLLCIMLCVWRSFYIDKGAPDSAFRIMTRHKVSLANFLPIYYRDKIRTVPGVVHVVPMTWFGGKYKDDKPENYFAAVRHRSRRILRRCRRQNHARRPTRRLEARPRRLRRRRDPRPESTTGRSATTSSCKARSFPTNLDLTLRGIYTIDPPTSALYFHTKYLEESVDWFKDTAGFYFTRVDTAEHMPLAAHAIDDMFHTTPVPTKSESEQAFKLDFIATLGSVKAFILSICGAVVFTTLLVCANTMAMSIRERTREVAVLRTLGFTRESILKLLLKRINRDLALIGGLVGVALRDRGDHDRCRAPASGCRSPCT